MSEKVDMVTQGIPIGVSGALIAGVSLNDWIVIGTAVLIVYNLSKMVISIYRGVIKRGAR